MEAIPQECCSKLGSWYIMLTRGHNKKRKLYKVLKTLIMKCLTNFEMSSLQVAFCVEYEKKPKQNHNISSNISFVELFSLFLFLFIHFIGTVTVSFYSLMGIVS